jgi:predicted amidohydrolase YtcJ
VLVDRHDVLGRVPRIPTGEIEPAVAAVSSEWAERGISGFTDATHTNGPDEVDLFDHWCGRGVIGQQVTAMVGVAHLGAVAQPTHVQLGHAKVMTDIAAGVAAAHRAGFPAAVHVMDIDTLDVTLTAFESDRPPPGTADRIEHNALCLPEQVERIAAVGATVVVNPSFLLHRAAKYRRELTAVEQHWLVRIRSLLDAGITVLAGSDSPVVPADPAETIAAATAHPFTPAESVSLEAATRMCREDA